MSVEGNPENPPVPPEGLEGVTHEDIVAAVAILREDAVLKQGRESREAIKALEERMNAKDTEDKGRWDKWEQRNPATPENDPEKVPTGVPPAPPPVPPAAPVEEGGKVKSKKGKGVWFAREEDKEEGAS